MTFARASIDQTENLRYQWDLAQSRHLTFVGGTSAFGSDFFSFTMGLEFRTVDKLFEKCGIRPLTDQAGDPIKIGQHFLYDIFHVQNSLIPAQTQTIPE